VAGGVNGRARGNMENAGAKTLALRRRMVARVREQGVRDPRVLEAMSEVPREMFVDEHYPNEAYEDRPVAIGLGQYMSQPYIVARSAELAIEKMLAPRTARILEIGTGCGYAAAVFARIFGEVYTIECLRVLHDRARSNLRPLRLATLRLVFGDGHQGWPEDAPYDAIIAAAAAPQVPAAWKEQLAPGGVIVAPIGEEQQRLQVLSKDRQARWVCEEHEPVRFVPLVSGRSVA
jgi:protein-L-isoaspartate(D-aspartate) O-methyltransferase